MARAKKQDEMEQKVAELTADLQRVRADFENYRRTAEAEKARALATGKSSAVLKLLPVVDNIERAIGHMPAELAGNAWADGVASLVKNLEKSLDALGVVRIDATVGAKFDPNLHEAIQFIEESEGDHEVVAEELQAGYTMNGEVIRTSMVKAKRG